MNWLEPWWTWVCRIRPGDELVDEIRALYPNMPIIQRRVMRTKASETASQM
jgi:hypothetical protein